MNILHISNMDRGGATAVRRLHYGLLDAGYESDLLTTDFLGITQRRKHFYHTQNTERLSLKDKIKIKLGLRSPHTLYDEQGLKLKGYKLGYGFTFPENLDDITTHPLYQRADIIHLHWVNRMIDYPKFFAKNIKPIAWTLHDIHTFTGGLHSAIGTDYTTQQLTHYILPEKNNLDKLLNQNLKIKRKNIENQNITVLPTTQKMKGLSAQSYIFQGFPHQLIPLGLDTNVFKPYNKLMCRAFFDLPENETVFAFVSSDITNQFKGLPLLLEAISNLDELPYLLAIGKKNNKITISNHIKYTGHISDEKLMALSYSASDFFITPSLEESFGQTTIEAMACGLPVISFNTWGAMDLINAENGIVVPEMTSEYLQKTLAMVLSKRVKFDTEKIRKNTVEKYNLDKFVNTHIDLYNKMLSQ